MGEVYRARDERLDREVAIKVLSPHLLDSPEGRERFSREARAAFALNHPNICTVFDVGSDPPFLAMELLDGETLQHRLGRGALDVPALIDIALALADGLDAAHGKGVIHRDIKPANIFLTSHGPKILDFGVAKAGLGEAPLQSAEPTRPGDALVTGPGIAVGTFAYMSPEQLRGEPLDRRTDLFSLGLVLYEMATGVPAFTGATAAAIGAAIIHERPRAPRVVRPHVPQELDQIVLKALEKHRDERYQTAADLRADLRRLKRQVDSSSSPALAASVVPAWRRYRLMVVGAAVVLASSAGVYFLSNREPVERPVTVVRSLQDFQVEQLTATGNADRPAVSPDGRYVAYVQADGNDHSLWVRQTATNSHVNIVPSQPGARIFGVTVTPDGNDVDFVKEPYPQFPMYRVPFLGGAPKKLLDGVWSPIGWSSDGQQMAFVRKLPSDSALVVAGRDGNAERVLVMRRDSAILYDFLYGGWPSASPSWSPDGRRIAVRGRELNPDGLPVEQVVVVEVGSGRVEVLALALRGSGGLAWLDDRTLILNQESQFWRMSYPEGSPG
jgi:serine/threonine protein kinase